jgi:Caspase domain
MSSRSDGCLLPDRCVQWALLLALAAAGLPVLAQEGHGAAVSVAASGPQEAAQRRLALVIGNAAYPEAPLANPVNDARAMTAALRSAGFEVISRENATHMDMLQALREFGDKLKAQRGTGLFYFAGHGVQVKGRNFLVPVGSRIEREDEVAGLAIDVGHVLGKMESANNPLNVLILDACRNNPFVRSFRSSQQGLAQMDAPVGSLIAFATAPGSVAHDGQGANGLYTHHLLTALQEPNVKVEDVFKRVRAAVLTESGGKQVPWESTSLLGDFYFRGGAAGQRVAAAAPEPARRVARLVLPSSRGETAAFGPQDRAFHEAPRYAVGDQWEYSQPAYRSQPAMERIVRVKAISPGGEVEFSTGEKRARDGASLTPGGSGTSLRAVIAFPKVHYTSWDARCSEAKPSYDHTIELVRATLY